MSDRSRPAARTPKQRGHLQRYDEALLAAKNRKHTQVIFDLAAPTNFTDSECSVKGEVCQVDKYSIELKLVGTERKVWISKAMIVGTEIL